MAGPEASPAASEASRPAADRPSGSGRARHATLSTGPSRTTSAASRLVPTAACRCPVNDARGHLAGWVARGNRKDIRDAVEAAFRAERWSEATTHLRSQILFYFAENLALRRAELADNLRRLTGRKPAKCRAEVDAAIARLFSYGGWADKYDGLIHTPPVRSISLAVPEPIGVVGVVCPDEAPLLGFISLLAPVIAMGNRCVIVPSERMPLPALDLCQVIETSDVPAGVVNIVTGDRDELTETLAQHDQVDCVWYFGRRKAASEWRRWRGPDREADLGESRSPP